MGTARVKQEEEVDTGIIVKEVRNMEERNVGTKGKPTLPAPQIRPT